MGIVHDCSSVVMSRNVLGMAIGLQVPSTAWYSNCVPRPIELCASRTCRARQFGDDDRSPANKSSGC